MLSVCLCVSVRHSAGAWSVKLMYIIFSNIQFLSHRKQVLSSLQRQLVIAEFRLMGYDSVQSDQNQPTFRRSMSPLSSGSKNKPSVTPAWSRQHTELWLLRTSICFSFRLLFYSEHGGDIFLRNVSWISPYYTALYPRRRNSLQPPLREPQILHTLYLTKYYVRCNFRKTG
jgi:hypothetical protein